MCKGLGVPQNRSQRGSGNKNRPCQELMTYLPFLFSHSASDFYPLVYYDSQLKSISEGTSWQDVLRGESALQRLFCHWTRQC
jgi:hypothetical protein